MRRPSPCTCASSRVLFPFVFMLLCGGVVTVVEECCGCARGRRRDLIFGSWGGRPRPSSSNQWKGITARESNRRFAGCSSYAMPKDEGVVSRRGRRRRRGRAVASQDKDDSPAGVNNDDDDDDDGSGDDDDRASKRQAVVEPDAAPTADYDVYSGTVASVCDVMGSGDRPWWTPVELTRKVLATPPAMDSFAMLLPKPIDPRYELRADVIVQAIEVGSQVPLAVVGADKV